MWKNVRGLLHIFCQFFILSFKWWKNQWKKRYIEKAEWRIYISMEIFRTQFYDNNFIAEFESKFLDWRWNWEVQCRAKISSYMNFSFYISWKRFLKQIVDIIGYYQKKKKRKEMIIILDFKLSRLSNYIFVILRVSIVFLIHCSTLPCVSTFRVHFSLFLQGRLKTRFRLIVSFMSANWNRAQYSTKNIVEAEEHMPI